MELKTVTHETRIPPLTKKMSDRQRALYDRMLVMAREMSPEVGEYLDGPNIHTDDALARRAGFPARIAPGVQTYSFLMEMLSRFFGKSWLHSGRIQVKFIHPLLIDEEITSEAEITRITLLENDEAIAELDLRCKNARGKIISVGRASVKVNTTTNPQKKGE